ncbi:RING-H2 finger protein ATL60 [Hordeum vulgare]|nr:RING-H2 finger protein ATL60 [Hordeum vulgare]
MYNRLVRHSGKGDGPGSAERAVCLGAIRVGAMAKLLRACAHVYHVECIDLWLASHSTCPLCRCRVVIPVKLPFLSDELQWDKYGVNGHPSGHHGQPRFFRDPKRSQPPSLPRLHRPVPATGTSPLSHVLSRSRSKTEGDEVELRVGDVHGMSLGDDGDGGGNPSSKEKKKMKEGMMGIAKTWAGFSQ